MIYDISVITKFKILLKIPVNKLLNKLLNPCKYYIFEMLTN